MHNKFYYEAYGKQSVKDVGTHGSKTLNCQPSNLQLHLSIVV
jgi:hypothetical protein